MKLSAFLAITVPMVAMAPLPALAGNEPIANTGSWVKESIATFQPVPAPRKISPAAAPTASTLRLRPFMPNRYLPKEKDMRQALVAQQAQLDPQTMQPEGGQPLSGNVSGYYTQQTSAYDQYSMRNAITAAVPVIVKRIKLARKQAGTRSARMTPGQMPVLPEQLVQAAQIQQIIPEPPMQRNVRPPVPAVMPMQLQPPKFSLQQQAALDKLVDQNAPPYHLNLNGELVGAEPEAAESQSNPVSLSLNPMQALMQSRCKANVPPARFGSWHANTALAHGGFHSWLPLRTPTHYEYYRAPLPTAAKRKAAKKHHVAIASVQQSTSLAPLRKPTQMLASYPVYTTPRGQSY